MIWLGRLSCQACGSHTAKLRCLVVTLTEEQGSMISSLAATLATQPCEAGRQQHGYELPLLQLVRGTMPAPRIGSWVQGSCGIHGGGMQ